MVVTAFEVANIAAKPNKMPIIKKIYLPSFNALNPIVIRIGAPKSNGSATEKYLNPLEIVGFELPIFIAVYCGSNTTML